MTINRTSIDVACAPCPRGTFGADPKRLSCETCWPGYLCYGNTTRGDPANVTSDRGEICPAGSYCGAGSYAPVQCARGTFNPNVGQSNVSACGQCPRNSFNNLTGQPACIPCGGSAVSSDDRLACECKGADRIFHPFDSACRCKAGYTIYDGVGKAQPDEAIEDGILDCEPIVLNRCGPTDLRSAAGDCLQACDETKCLSPPCYCVDDVDFCASTCPDFQTPKAEKMQIDDVVGTAVVCRCECPADSTNPKCADPNTTPIEKKYKLGADSAGTAVLTITDAAGATTYLVPGMDAGESSGAKAQFIGSSPDGFSGVLDAPDALFDSLGMLPCAMNGEGVCVATSTPSSRRADFEHTESVLSRRGLKAFETMLATGDAHWDSDVLRAGPTAYHLRQDVFSNHTDARGRGLFRRKSQVRAGALDDSQVTGVQSPLVCIKGGDGIMWSITSANGIDHFPEYVSDSLFNTNPSFDYGAFVGLRDKVKKGYPVTSFYFVFREPGIYTFRDAGDTAKETVVGVVDAVVDCPRAFEENPIQPLSAQLLKSFPTNADSGGMIRPDYDLIAIICVSLAAVLLGMLILLHIRKTRGWGQSVASQPHYRQLGRHEDFHQMASAQEHVRKGVQSKGEHASAGLSLDDVDDLAAGYVDLEGFNVQMLFDKLQDQTHLMAEQLTQQKHDVREFYDKVTRETVTLRTLVDKHNQSGFSADMVKRAERRQRDIDRELMRRKALGASALPKFDMSLRLTQEEAQRREEELASLDQAFNAINGLELNEEAVGSMMDADKLSRVREAIQALQGALKERKAQHSKVKFGDGALLLDRTRKPVARNALFDNTGALKAVGGLVEVDSLTGILVPTLGTEMKCSGRHIVSVPPCCCLHPLSGEIIPMEGNVFVDPLREEFVVMNPRLSLDTLCAEPLPYVVNHMTKDGDCYPSAEAAYAHLIPQEETGWPLNKDRTMIDPHTGLRVPVLAVTHDLRTKQLVAVGGAMLDPETRLAKPIQIGDIMEDPDSRDALMILGVRIDEATGRVQPIGANVKHDDTGEDAPLVFGAQIHDEFSGAPCAVWRCISDPLNPSRVLAVDDDTIPVLQDLEDAQLAALLETLDEQVRLIESKVSVRSGASLVSGASFGSGGWGSGGSSSGVSAVDLRLLIQKLTPLVQKATARYAQVQKVRAALNARTLDQYATIRDQHHRMYDMAATGGQKGSLVDPVTERELPILVGCFMYDEESKFDVQILDLEIDAETGLYEPLGCTVVDPLSGRQVSATIAGQMRDPLTNNTVPISGVRRDPGTYHVQAESNLRRAKAGTASASLDPKLLSELLKQLATSSTGSGALANLLAAVDAPTAQVASDSSARRSASVSTPPRTASSGGRVKRRPASISIDPADATGAAGGEDAEDLYNRLMRKLGKLAEQHRSDDDDEKLGEAFNTLIERTGQEFKDFQQSLEQSREEVMGPHLEAAREVLQDASLGEETRSKLLDDMGFKEGVLSDLIENENARELQKLEKMQIETANRRMRKMKQKQARERTLEALIESGDASATDRAVHQLQASMDEELEGNISDLNTEYTRKMKEEIAAEQARLRQALGAAGEIGPDVADGYVHAYDEEVEKIEARLRAELADKIADLEKHNDEHTARKVALLRETTMRMRAKKAWTDTKKLLGGVKALFKMGSQTAKSAEELQALAKERHDKERELLAKALGDKDDAERANALQALGLSHEKEVALLQQDFLGKLSSASDDAERQRLLDHHAAQLADLRLRQDAEKERQARDLEKKLAARRAKRQRAHASLCAKELALLEDPRKSAEAERVAAQAVAERQRETEEARMLAALQQQDASDILAVQAQQKARADAQRMQEEAAFVEQVRHVDDPAERERLIKEHELKVAEVEAHNAVAKGKAEDDLKRRLDERRSKRKAFLAEQAAQEKALRIASAPRSADELLQGSAERHSDLSGVLEQALDDAAVAETELLAMEIDVNHSKEAAVMDHEMLAKLESTDSDAERKRLLDGHARQIDELQKQQAMDKERQLKMLEKKLAARKEKRLQVEHAEMVAKEKALLADPKKHEDAVVAAVELELKVQQEVDAAQVQLELQQQAAAELAAMQKEQALVREYENKLREAALQESIKAAGNDAAARQRLLQEHDFKVGEMEARMAVDKGRAEEDLQRKLEERKRKRKEMLEAQATKQLETVGKVIVCPALAACFVLALAGGMRMHPARFSICKHPACTRRQRWIDR